MRLFTAFTILSSIFYGCSGDNTREYGNVNVVPSPIEIVLSNGNNKFTLGDVIVVDATYEGSFDSNEVVSLFLNDSIMETSFEFPLKFKFSTVGMMLGRNRIRITVESSGKLEGKTVDFTLYADSPPTRFEIEVLNTHPHDPKAFTQGLFYHGQFLYEGTGQKGHSEIRKVEIGSGKVLQSKKLEEAFFGEGITLLDNKIYQLSWNTGVGFIYNSEDFTEVSRFYYNGEGWGLTTDGKFLYRSDGTNRIHLHSISKFEELSSFEVYSDVGTITRINELEFADGKIYANLWQRDEIAIINPDNGKLEGLINLRDLLPGSDRDEETDVLNGIAYDAQKGSFYVTGKYWPKLFEIRLRPAIPG